MNEHAERVRAAAEAYLGGDVDPIVALLDPDVDWRGVSRGLLWWRRTPS